MDLFNHRKRTLEFWARTGEVLSQEKHSQTHVSGSGTVHEGNGQINIHSETTTTQEIWIRDDQGKEHQINLINKSVPMRPGHRVTVLFAGRTDKGFGYPARVINHTTGKQYTAANGHELNGKIKIDQLTGKSLLIAGAAWGLMYYGYGMQMPPSELLWLPAYWLGIRAFYKFARIQAMAKRLDLHLSELTNRQANQQASQQAAEQTTQQPSPA
ncbi:hypothetical protein [Ferrimonas marina]|uniref:Uncharacterized protein n=1 Tax=Ferrimonas marina TaxID=299255 RepID=A0A1M5S3B6_9GAMM|nr:hypothetical protein [Ferrimonas marina]SHH32946.1 hypothetical protein SAMN02745129_1853 [Ferrimonas marina]